MRLRRASEGPARHVLMNGSVGERHCFSLVPLGCLREAEKGQAGPFLVSCLDVLP